MGGACRDRFALPASIMHTHTHTHVGVHAQVDEILVWIKDALLALELVAVDQTEHNLRIMLDLGVAYVLLNVLLMWC